MSITRTQPLVDEKGDVLGHLNLVRVSNKHEPAAVHAGEWDTVSLTLSVLPTDGDHAFNVLQAAALQLPGVMESPEPDESRILGYRRLLELLEQFRDDPLFSVPSDEDTILSNAYAVVESALWEREAPDEGGAV